MNGQNVGLDCGEANFVSYCVHALPHGASGKCGNYAPGNYFTTLLLLLYNRLLVLHAYHSILPRLQMKYVVIQERDARTAIGSEMKCIIHVAIIDLLPYLNFEQPS